MHEKYFPCALLHPRGVLIPPQNTAHILDDQFGHALVTCTLECSAYARVIKYHPPERDNHGAMKSELFSVVYTDGDGEDFDLDELSDAIRFACGNPRT